MVPEWAADWVVATGTGLAEAEVRFLRDVDEELPGCSMWSGSPGRRFERLRLEGPADAPCVVVYFRSDERPGLLLGFQWDIERTAAGDLDWVVLMANLMEILDGAGRRLPLGPGADGVARFSAA